jgi:hypothetical protein
MANIKFSQFTQKTTLGTVDFLVGYTGADNVQIDPADLLSDYSQGTGAAGQVTFFSAASTVTGDNNLYWDNTNKRLGIGTVSPQSRLHITDDVLSILKIQETTGNTGASAGVLFKTSPNTGPNFFKGGILYEDTGDANIIGKLHLVNRVSADTINANTGDAKLTIDTSGNVGIGTTSPSAKLEVDGTLIATGISQLGSSGSNVYLTSSSAGNVGIGDSSPTAKLVVDNVGTKMLELKRSGNIKFRVLADANHGQLNMFNSGTSNTVRLHTSGDSYFNGGNVGIGTTSPSEKLHVQGNVLINGAAPYLSIKTTQTGTPDWKIYNSYNSVGDLAIVGGSSVGNKFNIQPNGNVGIGTSTPAEKLDVLGKVRSTHDANNYMQLESNSGGGVLSGKSSGTVTTIVRTYGDSYFNGGNFGIGTSSPTQKLDVVGRAIITKNGEVLRFNSSDANGSFVTWQNNGSAIGYIGAGYHLWASPNNIATSFGIRAQTRLDLGIQADVYMTILSSGNVGIGTTSPGDYDVSDNPILAVGNTATANNSSQISVLSGSNSFGYLLFGDGETGNEAYRGQVRYDHPNDSLEFVTAGSERMQITSAGNVGIGTTSPTAPLHIEGGTNSEVLKIEADSNPFVRWVENGTNVGYLQFLGDNAYLSNMSNGSFFFRTNNTDKMTILSGGNVGIGTTSPAKQLTISSTTPFIRLEENQSGGNKRLDLWIDQNSVAHIDANQSASQITLRTANTDRLRITNAGNVGIGTTSPASRLEVDGGDIEVDDSASGLILRSPDGTRYRVTVANGGTLSVSAV